jgi:hypothetical protein
VNESSDAAVPVDEPARKASLSERYKALLAEYGGIAMLTYLTIFALVLLSFATAIKLGFNVEGADEQAGTWFSAWLATKVTQPARILATLALTPVVASIYHRLRGIDPRAETETQAPDPPEA